MSVHNPLDTTPNQYEPPSTGNLGGYVQGGGVRYYFHSRPDSVVIDAYSASRIDRFGCRLEPDRCAVERRFVLTTSTTTRPQRTVGGWASEAEATLAPVSVDRLTDRRTSKPIRLARGADNCAGGQTVGDAFDRWSVLQPLQPHQSVVIASSISVGVASLQCWPDTGGSVTVHPRTDRQTDSPRSEERTRTSG